MVIIEIAATHSLCLALRMRLQEVGRAWSQIIRCGDQVKATSGCKLKQLPSFQSSNYLFAPIVPHLLNHCRRFTRYAGRSIYRRRRPLENGRRECGLSRWCSLSHHDRSTLNRKVRITTAIHRLTNSPVFADMLSLPGMQSKSFEFADPTIEDAATVRSFLHLMRDLKLDMTICEVPSNRGTANARPWKHRLPRLVSFLDKYDSKFGLKALKHWSTYAELVEDWNPETTFVFGALTDNIHLCAKALVHPRSNCNWQDHPRDPLNCRAFHLFHMHGPPYEFVCSIPPQFYFALCRASADFVPGTVEFQKKFVEVVSAAMASTGECLLRSVAHSSRRPSPSSRLGSLCHPSPP